MKKSYLLFGAAILLTLVVSACSPTLAANRSGSVENTAAAEEMMDETMPSPAEAAVENQSTEPMSAEHSSDADLDEENGAGSAQTITDEKEMEMLETPAWFDVALTNVRDGETFTINGLKGKVVLVETMAIWCSNCRKQQEQVADLHVLLGDAQDFVSVGLDIDPNEDSESLKAYIEQHGFHWTYAVAPAQVGSALANLYGELFLNPPSTPMLIVDQDGSVHLLPFGIKSAEQLKEALDPFLADKS